MYNRVRHNTMEISSCIRINCTTTHSQKQTCDIITQETGPCKICIKSDEEHTFSGQVLVGTKRAIQVQHARPTPPFICPLCSNPSYKRKHTLTDESHEASRLFASEKNGMYPWDCTREFFQNESIMWACPECNCEWKEQPILVVRRARRCSRACPLCAGDNINTIQKLPTVQITWNLCIQKAIRSTPPVRLPFPVHKREIGYTTQLVNLPTYPPPLWHPVSTKDIYSHSIMNTLVSTAPNWFVWIMQPQTLQVNSYDTLSAYTRFPTQIRGASFRSVLELYAPHVMKNLNITRRFSSQHERKMYLILKRVMPEDCWISNDVPFSIKIRSSAHARQSIGMHPFKSRFGGRVDFVLLHPRLNTPIFIEVDGNQHFHSNSLMFRNGQTFQKRLQKEQAKQKLLTMAYPQATFIRVKDSVVQRKSEFLVYTLQNLIKSSSPPKELWIDGSLQSGKEGAYIKRKKREILLPDIYNVLPPLPPKNNKVTEK